MSGLGAIHTHTTGSDTVTLQLTDLTGNVAANVDDNVGAILGAAFDYDPFGASVGSSPAPAKYGWLGGHQRAADDLGGLVLMGYRLYNPTTGRFLSADPVPGGGANAYDYVDQDPVTVSGAAGGGSSGGVCRAHRGMIATIAASAACAIPGVGWLSCAGLQAAAYGVRAQQRASTGGGWRKTARANLIDGGLTVLTFGLLRVPGMMVQYGRLGRFANTRVVTETWRGLHWFAATRHRIIEILAVGFKIRRMLHKSKEEVVLNRRHRLSLGFSGVVMAIAGVVFILIGSSIVSEKFDVASILIGVVVVAVGGIALANSVTSGVSWTPAGVRVRWLFSPVEYPGRDVIDVRTAREAHDIVPWDLIFPQIVLSSGEEINLKFLGSYWLGQLTERHVER